MTMPTTTLADVSSACYEGYHHFCWKELPDCICPCHGECEECACAAHSGPCSARIATGYSRGDPCQCPGGYKTIYPGWREEGP